MSISLLIALTLAGAPASTAAPAGAAAEKVRALVEAIVPRVEEIRGLKFKRPVKVEVVDDAAARAHFQARSERLWPQENARLDQQILAHLGLLPPGTQLLPQLLDLLQDQVRGYYDPGSDTFFLVQGLSADAAPAVIAHELTHALDDQYFDIDALAARAGEDDAGSALSAVVEGSGMVVMTVFLAQEIQAGRLSPAVFQAMQTGEAQSAARLRAAPPFFQCSLAAPYVLGMSFLARGDATRLATGVDARDFERAFTDPPQSTEQVLHAAKYWDAAAHDVPKPVALPDLSRALGPGWTLARQGSLGELLLALLAGGRAPSLEDVSGLLPEKWTLPAAAGISGDLYHHYVNGSKNATLLATIWDTQADAAEFLAALRPLKGRRTYHFGRAVLLAAGDLEGREDDLGAQALTAVNAGARR